jgi:hypothetical protein
MKTSCRIWVVVTGGEKERGFNRGLQYGCAELIFELQFGFGFEKKMIRGFSLVSVWFCRK